MRILIFLFLLLCNINFSYAAREHIILLASTSVENSGFLDYILPHFESETGLQVQAVITGSGAALQSGKRGNGDVLLTHSPMDESEFVAGNFGIERLPLMFNEFVIIGDKEDKAMVATASSVEQAFSRIAKTATKFIARSDNSGTDRREKFIWNTLGIEPQHHSWYKQSGSGMSAAFNIAVSSNAYIFGDNSSWARFGNKRQHDILFRNAEKLKNQYSLIAINPELYPHIEAKKAEIFIAWLLSAKGQTLINLYKIDGVPLFTANARSK